MKENLRLYLLISLGFHLGLLLPLFLIPAPQLPDLVPRRVVIEFTQAVERIPAEQAPQQSRLPDLEPRELVDSLQMEGPRTLPVPAVPAVPAEESGRRLPEQPQQLRQPQLQTAPSGGERLSYARREKPLLPQRSLDAGLLLPVEIPSGEIAGPAPQPAAENGFTQPGALEWKGRERKLLKSASISFPQILLEEGLEVDVMAVFTVAPSGQVIEVDIVRSSGYASVDRAVERALLAYLFEPSDKASNDVGQIQYRFRLERGD